MPPSPRSPLPVRSIVIAMPSYFSMKSGYPNRRCTASRAIPRCKRPVPRISDKASSRGNEYRVTYSSGCVKRMDKSFATLGAVRQPANNGKSATAATSLRSAFMSPNAKLSDRRPIRTVERKGCVRALQQHRAERRGGGSSRASCSAISRLFEKHDLLFGVEEDLAPALEVFGGGDLVLCVGFQKLVELLPLGVGEGREWR